MTGAVTFRQAGLARAPRWLQGTWGARLLFSIYLQIDRIATALLEAIDARSPSRAGATQAGIAHVGRDRSLTRALGETDADFASRLAAWLTPHRTHGSPYTLAEQVATALSTIAPSSIVRVVNASGRYVKRTADGSCSRGDVAWDWDGDSAAWSRCWVVLSETGWADASLWGDPGVYDSVGTWGTDATPEEVAAVRAEVARWCPRHAPCWGIVVVVDNGLWAVEQPTSGNWDQWINRSAAARYWDGTVMA